jgi:predicted transcriptional regulator
MTNLKLKTGTEADFFARGRKLARLADAGEKIPEEIILSFEDPAELMSLITVTRMDLFREIKKSPGSITKISMALKRDRSAVKRDIDILARAGMVTVARATHPGHGVIKEVKAVAERVSLVAEVA